MEVRFAASREEGVLIGEQHGLDLCLSLREHVISFEFKNVQITVLSQLLENRLGCECP